MAHANCRKSVLHIPCTGGQLQRQAIVSMYACQHADELPMYTESIRLRLDDSGATVSTGDVFIYDQKSFIVKSAKLYPGACRLVVDVVRAGLDPCATETLSVHRYKSAFGCSAGEKPIYLGDIQAVVVHDIHDIQQVHDSRQWVGQYRVYIDPENARKLDHLCILTGSRTLKVASIHDLNRVGKLPYALAEEGNVRLKS